MTGLEESHLMENLQKIANRITTGVIVAALILASAMLMRVRDRRAAVRLSGAGDRAVPDRDRRWGWPSWSARCCSDRRAKPREEHGPR